MKLPEDPLSSLSSAQRRVFDARVKEEAVKLAVRAEWVRERAFALAPRAQRSVEASLKFAKAIYDGSLEA